MKFKIQKLQLISFSAVLFLIIIVALLTLFTNSAPTQNDILCSSIYGGALIILFALILKPIKSIPNSVTSNENIKKYIEEIRVKKEYFIDDIMMDYYTKKMEELLLLRLNFASAPTYKASPRHLIVKGKINNKTIEIFFEPDYAEIFVDGQSLKYLSLKEAANKYNNKTKKLYDEIVLTLKSSSELSVDAEASDAKK